MLIPPCSVAQVNADAAALAKGRHMEGRVLQNRQERDHKKEQAQALGTLNEQAAAILQLQVRQDPLLLQAQENKENKHKKIKVDELVAFLKTKTIGGKKWARKKKTIRELMEDVLHWDVEERARHAAQPSQVQGQV